MKDTGIDINVVLKDYSIFVGDTEPPHYVYPMGQSIFKKIKISLTAYERMDEKFLQISIALWSILKFTPYFFFFFFLQWSKESRPHCFFYILKKKLIWI